MVFSRKQQIIFVLMVVIVGGIAILWFGGHYPVASVDGNMIWASDVSLNADLALSYYNKTKKAQEALGEAIPQNIEERAVRVGVLNELVERIIIREALVSELGEEVFENLLESRLQDLGAGAEFRDAAESLYGADLEVIAEHLLIPQASRDMLRGKLTLRGEDPEAWLTEHKKSASVKLYAPGYVWEDETIRIAE